MSLRGLVFDVLRTDLPMNALGIDSESLFPNFAPESPRASLRRFAVIRWGVAESSPGRDTTARPIAMVLWAYDREKDFGNITAILKRARTVLRGLEGALIPGGGAVLGIDFAFSSEDIRDDTYDAVARSETYKVAASGI